MTEQEEQATEAAHRLRGTHNHLDALAELYNIKRRPGEGDADLRKRISDQMRSVRGRNAK